MAHSEDVERGEAGQLLSELTSLIGRLEPGDPEDREMARWAEGMLAELQAQAPRRRSARVGRLVARSR